MGLGKAIYKDGLVKFPNGSFDPKGFVGVKKDEFVKANAGKLKADINDVWDLIVKHRPKSSSTSKKD